MSNEGFSHNELVPSRERVIDSLREFGKEDTQALELLGKWLGASEMKVERGEKTNLKHNTDWANLYRDAGLVDEAIEAYEACISIAIHEEQATTYFEAQITLLRQN